MTEIGDGLKRNSKDIASKRNSNFCSSSIFEKYCGNHFSKFTILKNFAGIRFRDSRFLGVKKGVWFIDFWPKSMTFIDFLPAKISSVKVSHKKSSKD